MRVLFALVAWGNDYVRDFLDVSLPTLMAEGNLADNDVIDGSHLLILTTQADMAAFEADPLLGLLKRTVPVEYYDIKRLRARDKYRFASRCQLEALRRSEDFDAVILLYPDMLWCRGGVRFAIQQMQDGALGLMCPAPAVLPEPTLAALKADTSEAREGAGRIVSVTPRSLAGIALRHHHPMWNGFDWDGNAFADYSSCLRWNVAGEGWLIHCFHLHPVALRVQRDNPSFVARFATSLDGEYVARLFDGIQDLAFATDTDTFSIATLREPQMGPFPKPGNKSSIVRVARWAEGGAFLLHRAFARIAFRWHDGPISEPVWTAAERRATGILAEVKDRLQTPDSILRVEDPEAYRVRRNRKYNPVFRKPPAIELPRSHAREPRSRLAAAFARNLAFGAANGTKVLLDRVYVGRWLRTQPAAVAAWQRTQRYLAPKSQMYAAASPGSFIRNILAPKR